MGFHSDIPIEKLDFDTLSSLVKSAKDNAFRPREFTRVPAERVSGDVPPAPAMATPDAAVETPEVDIEALRAKAHKTGFTEGFAQGYQQGQAEAPVPDAPDMSADIAQMEQARAMFTELCRTIVDHTEAHHTALRQSMEQTLIALATELAGHQIDALPAAYVARIDALVERIGKAVESTVITLNPEDMAVIAPFIEDHDTLAACTFQQSPELTRGAVDIRSGPNRLQTVLAETETAVEETPE